MTTPEPSAIINHQRPEGETSTETAWEMINFIAGAPSSFHAARQVADQLSEAGFSPVQADQPFDSAPGGYYLLHGGAVLAWFLPETADPASSGFRIIGAHTDSPGFKLKPIPQGTTAGFDQLNVEVYGGPLIPSWFDRELVLAGQVVLRDGSTHVVATPPIARIPHLAIHLDRSANDGFSPDRQQHTQPIMGIHSDASLIEVLAHQLGVAPTDILAHDLITADAQPGELFGGDGMLLAAGRLDNLTSVVTATGALTSAVQAAVVDGDNHNDIVVAAFFDHEEIGSNSATGAGGPLLEHTLRRVASRLGATDSQFLEMLARSTMVSADVAHSLHPNYPNKHDGTHLPILGQGPVLKTNANQRYASSPAAQAVWLTACEAAGISSQVFAGNNAVPCGQTIGPISATRLGITTVDVGVPILSMHSARELAHAADCDLFQRALTAYLTMQH